jgi:general stress protein 26
MSGSTPADAAVRAEARRILSLAPYGFVITTRAGVPAARLTEHLAIDDDMTVWIGTSPSSRKAAEITDDPAVVYAVESRDTLSYVSLTGRASIDDSPQRRRRLWRPHLEWFFPAGPDGGDFVLVRVAVERIELMSFSAGIHPGPYGLAPAILQPG